MRRVTISDLLEYISEDRINENVISTFKSLEKNDIENFLYNKAIAFEKNSISTTHLIFTDNDILLGYFSLANKSLILSKERLEKLSNTKKKRLMQSGQILENGHLVVNSYLIGQLGKNYNLPQERQIKGKDLLALSFELLLEIKKLITAKYVWLECQNTEKLINFYTSFGFEKIDDFISEDGLVVMIMKLNKKD
ncbi:GNAT family N-acetyltransferase [Leptotrichia sp.]|jgi:acetyltransferase, GNAT family|uniref:GNAT family N-acetyltransferase n=1 Tax=Leptotrichia sp. TaxID=104608 RepID=UPI001832FBCA|nr:GNAT family N-acetyltransferase [Leptotrichia sp.]MBB1534416.1 GNAT family N-acetyltransferase [Leptotrichia sp.]